MIKACYDVKHRELRLDRVGEHCSPHRLCVLRYVDIARSGTNSIGVYHNDEYIGIVRFDHVGYGIPV